MSPSLGPHRIWLEGRNRRRLLFRGHDALYVAFWRVRVRIFKPATVIRAELAVLLVLSVAGVACSLIWRTGTSWEGSVFLQLVIVILAAAGVRGKLR